MREITPTPDLYRHIAAVHRAEAEARRERQPDFAATLETWAINAERRAEACQPQPDLFGGASHG